MKNTTRFFVLVLVVLGFGAYAQTPESMFMPPPGQLPAEPTDYSKMVQAQKVKKHILSFGFFSAANRHLSLGYDKLFGTDMVFTCQLGIIGPGVNTNDVINAENPTGAFAEAGVKFFFSPDYVTQGTTRYNSMQGTYFKPEVVVSGYQIFVPNYSSAYTIPGENVEQFTGTAIILNIGKQWIMANEISLDVYAGIGYALNIANRNESSTNYYSYIAIGGTSGLALSAGLNLGVPF